MRLPRQARPAARMRLGATPCSPRPYPLWLPLARARRGATSGLGPWFSFLFLLAAVLAVAACKDQSTAQKPAVAPLQPGEAAFPYAELQLDFGRDTRFAEKPSSFESYLLNARVAYPLDESNVREAARWVLRNGWEDGSTSATLLKAEWERQAKGLEALEEGARRNNPLLPKEMKALGLQRPLAPPPQVVTLPMLLAARGRMKIDTGDLEGGWKDVQTALRVSRHLRSEEMSLVEALLGAGLQRDLASLLEGIAQLPDPLPVDPETLADLSREYDRSLPLIKTFANEIDRYKPVWVDLRGQFPEDPSSAQIEETRNKWAAQLGVAEERLPLAAVEDALTTDIAVLTDFLDAYKSQGLREANLPAAQRASQSAALRQAYQTLGRNRPLLMMVYPLALPNSEPITAIQEQTDARFRMGLTALAIRMTGNPRSFEAGRIVDLGIHLTKDPTTADYIVSEEVEPGTWRLRIGTPETLAYLKAAWPSGDWEALSLTFPFTPTVSFDDPPDDAPADL